MAEFPPGGEFRRFRRLLALTVPVARGLSPFLFHRCLPPKGSRGAAVTPDQQAIYIFYFIIEGMPRKVKSWFRFSFWGGFAAGYKFFS